MAYVYKFDSSGRCLYRHSLRDSHVPTADSVTYITDVDYGTDVYLNQHSSITSIPLAPSPYHRFDPASELWIDPRTDEEKYADAVRQIEQKRQQLLAASDWTDTLSAKTRLGDSLYTAWQNYRQALRDITKQPGYPFSVTWPKSPV